MDYNEALNYIFSLQRFGSKLSLERIQELLKLLGNPEDKYKKIHVAGTNGKGSTCALFCEVLREAGYKTGLYISPFVEDFRERIQINREMIPQEELAREVEYLKPIADTVGGGLGPVTEFEFVTALAFDYYAKAGCDFVVIEVGLGGRFDATNAIRNPELAVIASIGLDHCAILGDTYAKIAFEKCGIIKDGCDVVSYPEQREEALAVIKENCVKRSSALSVPDMSELTILKCDEDGSLFSYKGEKYALAIPGEHIVKNSLAVIEGAEILAKKYPISRENIKNALKKTRFGGRFEKIGDSPAFYIDGGHNPDCVEAISAFIKANFSDRKVIIIMGILADKDYRFCILRIASLADSFFAITPPNPRALSAKKTAEVASEVCKSVESCGSIPEAVEAALKVSKASTNPVIISLGSLYYIGDVKKYYLGREKNNEKD